MTITASGALGRVYEDGEVVIRQGDPGGSLFVIEEGTVDVVAERDGAQTLLRTVGPGELIGEMSLFEHEPRSATIRARGRARILTIDRRHFLRRINEDPTLAFRILEAMAHRVRSLTSQVVELNERLERLDAGDVVRGTAVER